jgi:hypothetical protein
VPSARDVEIEVQQYVRDWKGVYAKLELATRIDGDSYYYFWMSTNAVMSELGRYNDGVDNLLKSHSYKNNSKNVWHNLRLITYDNESAVFLEAYVDGLMLTNYTDEGAGVIISDSGYGIGEFQLIGRWDNLSVKRYLKDKPIILSGTEEEVIDTNVSETGVDGSSSWMWHSFNFKSGTYSATAVASKANYINGYIIKNFEIVEDVIPPSINLSSPLNNSWNNEEITFSYIPSDNSDRLANCSLIIDNKVNLTNSSINQNEVNSFILGGIAERTYNWSVNCTDYNGNENNSGYWLLNVDTSEPSIELNWPIIGYNSSSTSIELNFTVIDNGHTSLLCNLTLDGDVNNTDYIRAVNGSVTNYSLSGLSYGTHNWNVTCLDNASNINSSLTRKFFIDNLFPSVKIVWPLNDSYVNTGLEVILSLH